MQVLQEAMHIQEAGYAKKKNGFLSILQTTTPCMGHIIDSFGVITLSYRLYLISAAIRSGCTHSFHHRICVSPANTETWT
jgi:hypothetical protein